MPAPGCARQVCNRFDSRNCLALHLQVYLRVTICCVQAGTTFLRESRFKERRPEMQRKVCPCCGVEEWRHESVCRACQRPRGMGSAIMRAASLVPNRPGCERGDQTETHALSRSRSAILVSEYFVFLSRSATLQTQQRFKKKKDIEQIFSGVAGRANVISTLASMLSMRAPWAPKAVI
jgi:hypothetical protein